MAGRSWGRIHQNERKVAVAVIDLWGEKGPTLGYWWQKWEVRGKYKRKDLVWVSDWQGRKEGERVENVEDLYCCY